MWWGGKGDAGQLWILAVCRGTPEQIDNYMYKISFLDEIGSAQGNIHKTDLKG